MRARVVFVVLTLALVMAPANVVSQRSSAGSATIASIDTRHQSISRDASWALNIWSPQCFVDTL
jgi:hypothetical protein